MCRSVLFAGTRDGRRFVWWARLTTTTLVSHTSPPRFPVAWKRMFVYFTGVEVNEGDHMVQIYSESLYTAQEELLAVTSATGRRAHRASSSRSILPNQLARSCVCSA